MKRKEVMPNRFYSTSSAVHSPKILKTLEDAVRDGKEKVDRGTDLVYIVEIIKIVRPVHSPVEVVDVV